MINHTNNKLKSSALYLFWIYTLLVILWGAWVRISHSGDGCGDHWPLCNGNLIPSFEQKKTFIEYFHRLMSGAYGLFTLFIFFKFRKSENSVAKKISTFLFVFMILEALIGALLVKQNLVTVNDSILRLFVMCLHQLNSFLLAGSCFLLYLSSQQSFHFKPNFLSISFLILATTGAMASLAATLFPTVSLWEGILSDFSNDSHLFVRLRILHPILTISLVCFIVYKLSMDTKTPALSQKMIYKFLFALLVGVITLLTLSPIWLKIIHLLIAHLLWSEILKYQLLR